MKTKFFFMMIFIIVSWTRISAATHYYHLNNANSNEDITMCAELNDTLVVYAPDLVTNITWITPDFDYIYSVDSIIVPVVYGITSTWEFSSEQTGKWFTITFLPVPYEPQCMKVDTNFCTTIFSYTLNAQNSGCSYVWDDGSTNQTRIIHSIGVFWVETSSTCGTRRDSITVTNNNPNAPHLGPDQSFCLGDSAVLTTGCNNVNSYYWSTSETTSTISVNTTGTYWVYVVDNNGCQGRDTINITMMATPVQEIELATINTDPQSPNYGNNKITWQVNPALSNITTANLYRESGTDNYLLMNAVPYTDGEWTDIVNSTGHAWKYKISLVGSPCGEGELSESVQTIHCWISYDPINHVYTIQWDPYIIGDGTKTTNVNWYKVLSGNGMNQLVVRDSVSGTTTSLTLPNTTDSIFVVGADLGGSKGVTGLALSNKTGNPIITGIYETETSVEKTISVYPNPVNTQLHIDVDAINFTVELRTTLGQVILAESNAKTLDVSNLSKGVYFLRIIIDGTPNEKKIVIN